MDKKVSKALVKVLTLVVLVIAMLLSIPSSVIPSDMNDVVNNENGTHNNTNSSSSNKENALTQSLLLNDSDSSQDSLLTGTNTNSNISNSNNANSNNTNGNNSNNDNGTGGGSDSDDNQDHELADDDNHYVPGDLTASTADTTLKYFDVTLFNYKSDEMNNATLAADKAEGEDKDFWEGLYFSGGSSLANENIYYGFYEPAYSENGNENDIANVEPGKYFILSERGNHYLTGDANGITGKSSIDEGAVWTIKKLGNGQYTIQNEEGLYLNLGNGVNASKMGSSSQTLNFTRYNNDNFKIQIENGGYYLNQNDTSANYGGFNVNNDSGNSMFLIKVDYYTPTFDNSGNATIEDGYYYIVNDRSTKYLTGTTSSITDTTRNNAVIWHISGNSNNGYTVQATTGEYLSLSRESIWGGYETTLNLSGTSQTFNIKKFTGSGSTNPDNAITFSRTYDGWFSDTTYYINDSSTSDSNFGTNTTATNAGNAMYLIKLKSTEALVDVKAFDDAGNNILTNGTYYIYGVRGSHYLKVNDNNQIEGKSSNSEAFLWTITSTTNGYYIQSPDGKYMTIGDGAANSKLTDSQTVLEIVNYPANSSSIQIRKKIGEVYYYLNHLGGGSSTSYGGYNVADRPGDEMRLKKVGTTYVLDLPEYGRKSIGYAPWNTWTGGQNCFAQGDARRQYAAYTFNSLVKDELDANKNIQFNFPQGGIFDVSDTTTKDVYTNVGLPFLYTNGFYSFDALADSARFVDGAASNKRLTWNDRPQQYIKDQWSSAVIDGGFFPFDNGGIESPLTNNDKTYHFGMKAELNFYMTPDGKSIVDGNDIYFDFAGDDDVWVFIDGKLVLDMGGIHDSVDGHLNFAQNTSVVYSTKSQYASGYFDANNGEPYRDDGTLLRVETAPAGDKPQPSKLFNDSTGEGLLGTTLEEFSNMNIHTLTIYYLERGMSESNFELGFNLPINDTINVTKRITQSKTSDGKISELTDLEEALVNNLDYTFVLYRDGKIAANYPYKLLDSNLDLIKNGLTDANGEFTIKNTQIASFVDDIGQGDMSHTYYVVEKQLDGFATPDSIMNYRGTGTAEKLEEGTGWQSPKYKINGLTTHMDSVSFIFTNYLNSDLVNPSIYPNNDYFVLDFGIKADLGNVLANDVYKADRIAVTNILCSGNSNSVSVDSKNVTTINGEYGVLTIDKDGNTTYSLNKQLTKPEVFKYTVTASSNSGVEQSAECLIYIMPATSIYYEENFDGLIKFNYTGNNPWSSVGQSNGNIQESGRVGTVGDSCYGSDKSYLDDLGDSNGTSYYANTSAKAAQFEYTFTGTGTSFFARTSNTTGTMRVRVRNVNNEVIYELMRDTSYKTDNDSTVLYNIPVFTYHAEEYGTYKVEVTIAKEKVTNSGLLVYRPEFYLDGVTVFNPLDQSFNSDEEKNLVNLTYTAYERDAEANNTVLTLRNKFITEFIKDKETWSGEKGYVVFTDTNGEILLGESSNDQGEDGAKVYVSDGPKEEVYMVDGQSVKFALKGWESSDHRVYLGLKSPMGPSKVLINGHEITITNTKECYYDITNYVTLVEDTPGVYVPVFVIEADKSDIAGASETGLISVTNIRVTGKVEFDIVPKQMVE